MAGHSRKVTQLTFGELCGNSDPVIRTGTQSGHVRELTDGAPAENVAVHSYKGRITFADQDRSDIHLATTAALGSGYLGKLTLGAVDQSADKVGWTFTLPDSAIDHLQAGQTLVQTYRVRISDGHGGTDTQDIAIRIVGTNDAPVITSPPQSATITEIADGAPGENAITHAAGGTIKLHDVDTLDTHSATVAPQANGYLGTLTLGTVNQAADTIGWTFEVPDSVLDGLRDGETLSQSYDVTIGDGHGGIDTTTITVTIVGSAEWIYES